MNKIKDLNVFDNKKQPNHVLINEYLSNQGIMVLFTKFIAQIFHKKVTMVYGKILHKALFNEI